MVRVAFEQELQRLEEEMMVMASMVESAIIMTNPQAIQQANYLLWTAHNLERVADRVTNICERVIFTVTGELVELDSDTSGIESIS